jgi:hypothetical protein
MSEAESEAQRACIRVLDYFRPFENSNRCRSARAFLGRRCSASASCGRSLDAAAAAAIDILLLVLERSDASLQEKVQFVTIMTEGSKWRRLNNVERSNAGGTPTSNF